MNYYVMAFKKFTQFEGRSSRSEYWYFALFNFIVSIAISAIAEVMGTMALGGLSILYSLAIIIPSVAVSVRRLHDTNRSGWWILISLVPIIGFFVFLYFAVQPSDEGDNQYGPNPFSVMEEDGQAPVSEPVVAQAEQKPTQQ